MTDLQLKTHLTRLGGKVKDLLAALMLLEGDLEDAVRARNLEELALALVVTEGGALDLLHDVRELLAEASALRGGVAQEVRTP